MSESSKMASGSNGGPINSTKADVKDFASRHRVKKLLETYTKTADRSLMGPEASEEAFGSQKKYYSASYKLPPDVELSKTSPPNDKDSNHESSRVDFEASKRLQMQMAMVQAQANAQAKSGSSPPPVPPSSRSSQSGSNGLVTLSRIDGNGYNNASEFHQRNRNSGGHLTGEMIRQINSIAKHKGNPAALVASLQDYQRQQLQMQATYERVLREKSYLKYNNISSGNSKAVVGPVFSARDRGQANLSETRLANRNIACFEVGGEKRCCLPQILNSVLDQISLQAIHAACDELQIYCSTCTPEQLDVLKLSKIIPNTASQCGLITKSDAERLCSRLLDQNPPVASMMGFHAMASPFSFRVQHECFGKCRGIVLPEAYTSSSAQCIECLECEGLFCPAKFVCHSHRNRENRTCHWGFDSANWRAYLHLADDYTEQEMEKLNKIFADFKGRYNGGNKRKTTDPTPYNGGRDRSLDSEKSYEAKKAKTDEQSFQQPPMFSGDPYGLFLYQTWASQIGNGKGGQVHPAAIAAWSSSYAQAIKDGKTPMAPPPGFSPGMLPPRPSSSTGHNGHRDRGNFEAKIISPNDSRSYVKSSPVSENADSPTDRQVHSIEAPRNDSQSRRPSKSNSLAEDILAIRSALDGASASARERTLKILERLTARLAVAESERDVALDNLKKLQRRHESTEEELHKKRAELREALRNDAIGPEIEFASKKFAANLPKMELKSPARVMEEKSCESSSSRSATPPVSASALHAANQAAIASVSSAEVESPSDSASMKLPSHLRRSSGTPVSIKSRESEDVRERLMSMEAELRALRDELSNRSSLASNTSSQATIKEKEEVEAEKAATEKKTDPEDPPEAKKAKIQVENEAENTKNNNSKT